MIINYSKEKLENLIFFIIGSLLILGLFFNIWNITHLTEAFEFADYCNPFVDVFGNKYSGCFVTTPDFTLLLNSVFLGIWVFILLSSLNNKKHFIEFKNIDKTRINNRSES